MISISYEFVVKWRKGSNFFSFHEIIEKKKWEIIIKKILGKFSVLDNFPNSMLEAIYISDCMSPHFYFPILTPCFFLFRLCFLFRQCILLSAESQVFGLHHLYWSDQLA